MPSLSTDLIRQLCQVKPPIMSASTLPPVCYWDSAVFERERHAVFGRSWIGVGRADRWKEPGDFAAMELAGVPVIVVRDIEGTLRAFANSCRHRGAMLLEGAGNCRGIKCPFHGWAYKLDGRLAGAPHMEQTLDFDRSEFGLVSFRIAERHGFAFVCLGSDTVDIDTWLGDFGDIHAPWSLETLVSARRREFEVNCNWKNFIEVFNEYYHLPYVHPDSIDDVYDPPDAPDAVTGQYATQFGTTQGTGGLLTATQEHQLPPIPGLDGRNRQGTRYTWLYPNMTFAASTEAIWMYEAYPISPGRTRIGMTICFPPEALEDAAFGDKADQYYHRCDVAIDEDIPFLEQQQRGLTSPYAKPGRYSYLEPSVANFACWYADRMVIAADA